MLFIDNNFLLIIFIGLTINTFTSYIEMEGGESLPEYINVGNLFRGEGAGTPFKTAPANFTVGSEDSVIMTKQVENPDQVYFKGDTINFVITITNTEEVAINNLVFRDDIPTSVLPPDGTNFTIATTSGTVTSDDNTIEIVNIDIPAGETVTIMISGIIA